MVHGRPFADCGTAEQVAQLKAWDDAAFSGAPTPTPPPFFVLLKQLVISAYYTSQIGQDVELETTLDAGENEPYGPVMMSPPFKI